MGRVKSGRRNDEWSYVWTAKGRGCHPACIPGGKKWVEDGYIQIDWQIGRWGELTHRVIGCVGGRMDGWVGGGMDVEMDKSGVCQVGKWKITWVGNRMKG